MIVDWYNVVMQSFLPISFLIAFFALFGISWIVVDVDPDTAPWYFFGLLVLLVFLFIFNFLGTLLYFLRTRFYKKYDAKWYLKTSFKMAFFVAAFISILAVLSILQLVSMVTIGASILLVGLLAVWVYLGKK